MKDYKAKELLDILNKQDECDWIEAKGGHESSQSVMETVCAFANEPTLGGGYILFGVAEDRSSLFPQYKTVNIADPDKLQNDFVTQCSSMFNFPVRPKVTVERVRGDIIVVARIDELPQNQKPLYFKSIGLPQGAYRRIGSTDQRCTEDDLGVFYSDFKGYDQTPMVGTTINDIDESAITRYRTLREKVNPAAEELSYNTEELLEALGCVNKQKKSELNLAGLVLFGTSKALRSYLPMLRVDYIRVPGNEWVQDPDDRFTTIDMRGPLLTLVFRVVEAINNDLPKGFLLQEGELQATSVGLPAKALREAVVNAVMHRSYREHRPVQVIRYDNRIEIINPGFSLKAQDKLGEPGSETRNPFIAAVFHETNLAETKGSGIRAMRKLMKQAHLAPPTFETDRSSNEFTSRLLLHHLLDENDIHWLSSFDSFQLNDGQKLALIFVREVGAVDNVTYRQMADCDTLKASQDLRTLKSYELLTGKGRGRATYYVPGKLLESNFSAPPGQLSTQPLIPSTPPQGLSTQPQGLSTQPQDPSTQPPALSTQPLKVSLPDKLLEEITSIERRVNDPDKIISLIIKICAHRPHTSDEIAKLLNKREDYIRRKFLNRMIAAKQIAYLYPEMINHPEQAYTVQKS